jgi:hypothetical protein
MPDHHLQRKINQVDHKLYDTIQKDISKQSLASLVVMMSDLKEKEI